MEPENQLQDNFDLKIKLEVDLSPPTRGQRSLSSRCIMEFISFDNKLDEKQEIKTVMLWRQIN